MGSRSLAAAAASTGASQRLSRTPSAGERLPTPISSRRSAVSSRSTVRSGPMVTGATWTEAIRRAQAARSSSRVA